MRIRLLASAAALAAALLLPSGAFAVTAPVITTPATTPTVTNVNVHLVWGDVPDEINYRVFRADADCVTNRVDLTLLGILPADTVTYDDAPAADGTYCYQVEAVDLDTITVADSAG